MSLRLNPDNALVCPSCGEDYTHHYKTVVFNRENEDSRSGLKATVQNQEVTLSASVQGNPSSRRNGIEIYFDCETCDAISVLLIWQHKGQTYLQTHTLEDIKL